MDVKIATTKKAKRLSSDSAKDNIRKHGFIYDSLVSLSELNRGIGSIELGQRIEAIEDIFIALDKKIKDYQKKNNLKEIMSSEIIEDKGISF